MGEEWREAYFWNQYPEACVTCNTVKVRLASRGVTRRVVPTFEEDE